MSTTETVTAAGTWNLDPVHSLVGFEVPYLAGTFKGSFRDITATLTVADGQATLEGTAEVRSIDVREEHFNAHLQGPEFFDSERHPQLRFRADDVRLYGATARVGGEITIKGVTRPLVATGSASGPMTDGFGNERLGLTLRATVDRTEFGITWNMPLPTGQNALPNEVTIVADLQLVKAG